MSTGELVETAVDVKPQESEWIEAGDQVRCLIDNVAQAFLGKEEVVTQAVLAMVAGGHVLLEDVPGVGKTLLAKAIAKSIDGEFKRLQFTADLLPSDITGVTIYSQERHEFHFRKGPVFTNILLGDEINRATPRTQSALLEAMEERHVSVDGEVYPLQAPFFVVATQNPVELEGTYPLPFAQMDRFMVRLKIGYLSKSAEKGVLRQQQEVSPLEGLEPVLDCQRLQRAHEAVRQIRVEDVVLDYIIEIMTATREAPELEYGASPRGSLDLQTYSQALALLEGREYVLPDDVKSAARLILPHRLIAKKGGRSVSLGPAEVIDHIIESVPVPL